MRKSYFLIVDTETTQDNLVADFGAVVCDRKGNIFNSCAVLTGGVFTDPVNHPLFFTSDPQGIWSKEGQAHRYANYQNMINGGSRMIASISAINNWLAKAVAQYQPILTAYNLAFDLDKCRNTGIDLNLFSNRFCLWHASYAAFAKTKAYRSMVLDLHAFNPPTKYGNMSFKTNAETMARFCLGNPDLEDEPHTALEDVIHYELPILQKLCKSKSNRWLVSNKVRANWRAVQVKDCFKPS